MMISLSVLRQECGFKFKLLLLLLAIVFILNGLSLIPYPGLQQDEVLFTAGIYGAQYCADSLELAGRNVPLMLLPYLGALKSWLYGPIVWLWAPSRWSVRVPALLLGVITLLAFGWLVRRVSGTGAALMATALLATDASFLLTTVFDWGPVALQHVLTLLGICALVRFHRSGSRTAFRAGWFCFGLALWNKALFVWLLSGMALAAAMTLRAEIRRHWTRRRAVEALGCLALGALPLILYNAEHGGATFRIRMETGPGSLGDKMHVLGSTLDGSGLFGYLVREDGGGAPAAEPESPWESASVVLSRTTGPVRASLAPWLAVTSVVLLPWLWRTPARRPVLFALITMAVAWLEMLATRGAGGTVHHAVLLWPWPQFLVGVAFDAAGRRLHRRLGAWPAALLIGGTCVSSLLVTNQYRLQLIRYGAAGSWTDAIYALSESLRHVQATEIYVTDWGILDPLRFLHQGRLPLRESSAVLQQSSLGEADRQELRRRLAHPGGLFIGHVDGEEQFAGVNARLVELAREEGYEKERRYLVRDRHGRAVFEVFRFRPSTGGRPG